MSLLVRSWNLFHGNAFPPERGAFLRELVELASADRPDVLCLQEVPLWATPRLAPWSGMAAFVAVARRAPLGVLLGRALTAAHHGLVRSALSGQANAILVAHRLAGSDEGAFQISEPGRERRVCHAVRLADGLLVANLHATNDDPPVARRELARAGGWLDARAGGGPLVVAGDFNVPGEGVPGFSPPGPGIDQIVARGVPSTPLEAWQQERRRIEGRLVSDHAPVELRVG